MPIAIGPYSIDKSRGHIGEHLPTTQRPPFQNLEYPVMPEAIRSVDL